ncbi:MAG: hypothetical protein ABIK09_13375 [Pseudomonadota bacterium]
MGKASRRKKRRRNLCQLDELASRSFDRQVTREALEQFPGAKLGERPAAYSSSSDVLEELMTPWIEDLPSHAPLTHYQSVVQLALLAWNAMEIEDDPFSAVKFIISGMKDELRVPAGLETILLEMCIRKAERFPDDHRIFINASMARMPSGQLRLTATASFPSGPDSTAPVRQIDHGRE